jgi:hypothetical protein
MSTKIVEALRELVECDKALRRYIVDGVMPQNYDRRTLAAFEAARAALAEHDAQPAAEPAPATPTYHLSGTEQDVLKRAALRGAQPAAEPLTDEQIEKIRGECIGRNSGVLYAALFARAIEAAVRAQPAAIEGNGGDLSTHQALQAAIAEIAELDALRDRLVGILSRTAIALRGPEPPLTRWSWHDLPERAEAAIAEVERLRAAEPAPATPTYRLSGTEQDVLKRAALRGAQPAAEPVNEREQFLAYWRRTDPAEPPDWAYELWQAARGIGKETP